MNSRVIKFRAFDTQRNVMYSAAELGRDEMQLHPDGRGFFNASSVSQRLSQYYSHLLPMQFTGLCDKNGKEIYEGDICRLVNAKGYEDCEHMAGIRAVEWNDVNMALQFSDYVPLKWGGFESIEVIGNIYQNPELLQ